MTTPITSAERILLLSAACEDYQVSIEEKNARIAELERKLAEQQASHDDVFGIGRSDGSEELNNLLAAAEKKVHEHYAAQERYEGLEQEHLGQPATGIYKVAHDEELAKAKEEGRKEAVPDGCRVVQNNPVAVVECKEVHGNFCQFIHRTKYGMSVLIDGDELYAAPKPEGTQYEATCVFDDMVVVKTGVTK